MEQSTTPVGIQVDNENQHLQIEWKDGKKSEYPLFGLRKNCPCVTCRGGHASMNEFEPEAFFLENPPRMNITNAKPIGNHALQITWIDGHNSGMYRWETLRWLDPENHT
ncbi:MAG: DUF971 domain-containing protein [Balneolales bacterium]|nr:DUF971 domain-containing protein [Balneolales bacterium]